MRQVSVGDWIQQIQSAYNKGEHKVANNLLRDALHDTSDAPQLLEIAGMLKFNEGDYRLSVELIERAMFEVSLSISSQMMLANAWIKLDEPDRSLPTLEFLVEQIQRVPCWMLNHLTNAVVAVGRHDLAIGICTENYRRHRTDHLSLFGIGFHIWQAGRKREVARAYMEHAIEMAPDSGFYRFHLATLLLEIGDDDLAHEHIKAIPIEELPQHYSSPRHEEIRLLLRRKQDFLRLATILTVHGRGNGAAQ